MLTLCGEDLCPPPFNANIFCGTGGYFIEERYISNQISANPVDCHIACLRELGCLSFQIAPGSDFCQLQTQSVDASITPNRPQYFAYDRNCAQYLPDACLEPEEPKVTPSPTPADPTPTPDGTPAPTPSPEESPAPKPTPEPVSPICGREGNAPSGQLIDIIPADSPAACKQACLETPQCLGFSLTNPFQGGCGLWSIGAKDIDPPATSGQFFYDKQCIVPGASLPDPATELPVCGREGMGSEEQIIEIIALDTLSECSRACGERPQCLGFSGTMPSNGVCGLWSIKAKDIEPKLTGLYFYDKECLIPGTTVPPPVETPKPTCNPSPFGSLVCRLEGTRANTVGLIDSAPVESFADCKQYCAVETDCLSFSTDSDNRCKLWSLKPEDRVAVRPGAGTFFFDRACETDAPTAPDALPPCKTPAPTIPKRQVIVPSYIPVTVPASRITSACNCLIKMPGYMPTGVVLVTQTIFENTTITRTTTLGTFQIDTLTLTATAFNTAKP